MKTSNDPRHTKRQRLVQELFSRDFNDQHVSLNTQHILQNQEAIDEQIQQAASEFPLDKMNKIDLAILRLATYELIIERKTVKNVIIDEAVELAKEFGNDTSPGFVNGVLQKISTYEKSTKI